MSWLVGNSLLHTLRQSVLSSQAHWEQSSTFERREDRAWWANKWLHLHDCTVVYNYGTWDARWSTLGHPVNTASWLLPLAFYLLSECHSQCHWGWRHAHQWCNSLGKRTARHTNINLDLLKMGVVSGRSYGALNQLLLTRNLFHMLLGGPWTTKAWMTMAL